jgi:hypothetical protein
MQHTSAGLPDALIRAKGTDRRSRSLFLGLLLSVVLPFSHAISAPSCVWDDQSFGEQDGAAEYMLGIDKLLEPVLVRFFPDGHVCGMNPFLDIRFEGTNPSDGQLQLSFLTPPALAPEERNSTDEFVLRKKYIIALFSRKITGEARKQLTTDLFLWDGQAQDEKGRKLDFYLKRTRPNVPMPNPSNKDAVNYCGDGGCEPFKFVVSIKPQSEAKLLQDIKQMPVDKIERFKGDDCPYIESQTKKGDACFVGMTWPFEEGTVVNTLKLKSYVRAARRFGGDAGTDTDTLVIKSDTLLSQNLRINIPVAIPIFQDAITKYFDGTGLPVPDVSSRQNSLMWVLKGRRAQFEKTANPSPAERSEWWKVRLQVAITEANAGTYILVVGMPETRTTAWALDSVPTDEKFTTELTNDNRFLDLQGRLIVAMTKFIAAAKVLP